jgi:hypothetical protein
MFRFLETQTLKQPTALEFCVLSLSDKAHKLKQPDEERFLHKQTAA